MTGGGGGGTTNLLSALLLMLVRVKLASGSKKGARGGEGGRGLLFVGIDLCRGGAGNAPAAPRCPDGGGARRERWAGGGVARGDPRPEQPSRRAHAAVPFR